MIMVAVLLSFDCPIPSQRKLVRWELLIPLIVLLFHKMWVIDLFSLNIHKTKI